MFKSLVNLIYPKRCLACNENLLEKEKNICSNCLINLPKTYDYDDNGNALCQLFAGRIKIEMASAFLFFTKKGIIQHLIHQLKYNNKAEVGIILGKMHAFHLNKTQWIKEIDYIVPVPLHVKRQKKRGYNQAECIAKGLSSVLNIPINNNNLFRAIYTETQTRKDKNSRIDNVKDVFALRDAALFEGKHILLVDDVVTTGATVFGCEKVIRNVKGIKLYLCCLAIPK